MNEQKTLETFTLNGFLCYDWTDHKRPASTIQSGNLISYIMFLRIRLIIGVGRKSRKLTEMSTTRNMIECTIQDWNSFDIWQRIVSKSMQTKLVRCVNIMMTSSNGSIFRVTGHLCGEFSSPVTGEFPAQRPGTRSFDVCFELCPNKRLSKQWWDWW